MSKYKEIDGLHVVTILYNLVKQIFVDRFFMVCEILDNGATILESITKITKETHKRIHEHLFKILIMQILKSKSL